MPERAESAAITPNLDAGVLPPPRPKIGFVIGIVFVAVIENVGNSESRSNLALLSYFVILALVVVLHELGHLAAGWFVGTVLLPAGKRVQNSSSGRLRLM